jgi:hypothetical protein
MLLTKLLKTESYRRGEIREYLYVIASQYLGWPHDEPKNRNIPRVWRWEAYEGRYLIPVMMVFKTNPMVYWGTEHREAFTNHLKQALGEDTQGVTANWGFLSHQLIPVEWKRHRVELNHGIDYEIVYQYSPDYLEDFPLIPIHYHILRGIFQDDWSIDQRSIQ